MGLEQEDDRFAADLGQRLKALREERGTSQQRLSELAGVTKSFVSQVERGKVMPSIATIRRLANALGFTLARLFAEVNESHPEDRYVVRAERRRELQLAGRNVELFLLAPDINRSMEPILNILRPGESTCEEPLAHEGEEWLYIQKGTARLLVGTEQMVLGGGDCAYFHSTVPHQVTNIGDGMLEIIWVVTPPLY